MWRKALIPALVLAAGAAQAQQRLGRVIGADQPGVAVRDQHGDRNGAQDLAQRLGRHGRTGAASPWRNRTALRR